MQIFDSHRLIELEIILAPNFPKYSYLRIIYRCSASNAHMAGKVPLLLPLPPSTTSCPATQKIIVDFFVCLTLIGASMNTNRKVNNPSPWLSG